MIKCGGFMLIEIIRREFNAFETMGFLLFNQERMGFTLESPWLNNRRNVSCIPEGTYICSRVINSDFGNTWRVGIRDRDGIDFHWGNTIKDTEGCIIVGKELGDYKGYRAVLDSKTCHKELMYRTRDVDQIKLLITNAGI
jgi:hypothetical protein